MEKYIPPIFCGAKLMLLFHLAIAFCYFFVNLRNLYDVCNFEIIEYSMKIKGLLIMLVSVAAFCSCGSKHDAEDFPENFDKIGDAGRVAYMMEHVGADSVARFICDAALGKVKGAKIDTITIATLYAYENYKNEDLASFSDAFDNYSANLPLSEKMKIYSMSGKTDPQGLGYQLGLEYVNSIRMKRMSGQDVEREIIEFKKACGSDKDTYRRFVKGFKTVLQLDRGNDLPQEVYDRFINMSEE